ncbi:MAG: hypothetical protein AB8B71_08720 [Paracoccaceae bacterium]
MTYPILAVSAFVLFTTLSATSGVAQSDSERADPNIVVMSHWSVKLPFALDKNDPLTVGDVLDPMWPWITPGQRITSVNGIEIGNLNAVRAVLRMSTEMSDQTQIIARFGTETNGEVVDEIAVLPVVQDTVLKNGMHFETLFDGRIWVSTLVALPQGVVTDLQVGDQLVSYGDQVFDARQSVRNILQKERRKGNMSYDVVFTRNGQELSGMIELMNDAPASQERIAERDTANIVVLTQWNVKMPMEADPLAPSRVARTQDAAIVAGDQIVSVNGIEIGNINAVSPVLRLSTDIEEETGMVVDLGVQRAGSDEVTQTRMSLPIVQDTVLGNGMRFETTFATHSWETYLVSLPEDADTDLKVGDRILAYGNGMPVNMRTSIKDIIEADRRKGMQDYEVVVLRDGDFMKCKLYY